MKKLYRALVYLVTFAIPVVIAACYGMSYRYRRGGRVLDKTTSAPISQIDVKCESGDGGFAKVDTTGSDGEFQVEDSLPCPSIQFVDALSVADAGASDAGATDAGASDAGVLDAGASDAGQTQRAVRYHTKVMPFGEDAGHITVELDRSN
ncbi:MAG: hypothetical protein ACYC8T_02495 [Myxococcaceae bacterium]